MRHLPIYILFITILSFQACEVQAGDDVLWLARSCVGEAGWNSYKTGECAAMLHVYRKRARLTGESPAQIAKRYSAAIKKSSQKRNAWVLSLKENGERPANWPRNIKWEKFRAHWVTTLIYVELFEALHIPDPLPEAMHYGSIIDKPPINTRKIKTKFRNCFYSIRKGLKW